MRLRKYEVAEEHLLRRGLRNLLDWRSWDVHNRLGNGLMASYKCGLRKKISSKMIFSAMTRTISFNCDLLHGLRMPWNGTLSRFIYELYKQHPSERLCCIGQTSASAYRSILTAYDERRK